MGGGQPVMLLAKNGFSQMVFANAQGVIHLQHHETQIALDWVAFYRFAHWMVEGNLFALNQSGTWRIQESPDGAVELWLETQGLRLTVMEFFAFTELMRNALARFEQFQLDHMKRVFQSQRIRCNVSLN